MFNLECVGPDGIDSFMPTPIYPQRPETFEFYEPTNGLRSFGDILRPRRNPHPPLVHRTQRGVERWRGGVG